MPERTHRLPYSPSCYATSLLKFLLLGIPSSLPVPNIPIQETQLKPLCLPKSASMIRAHKDTPTSLTSHGLHGSSIHHLIPYMPSTWAHFLSMSEPWGLYQLFSSLTPPSPPKNLYPIPPTQQTLNNAGGLNGGSR